MTPVLSPKLVESDILCFLQQRAQHGSQEEIRGLLHEICDADQLNEAVALLCDQLEGHQRPSANVEAVAWLYEEMFTFSEMSNAPIRFVSANLGFFREVAKAEASVQANIAGVVSQQEINRLSLQNEEILRRLSRLERLQSMQAPQQDAREIGTHPSRLSPKEIVIDDELPAGPSTRNGYLNAAKKAVRHPAPASESNEGLPSKSHQPTGPLVDEDGFQLPKPRNKRPPPRCGTATTSSGDPSGALQGVERRAHIFVFRLGSETTEEQMSNYCRARDVGVVSCERVDARTSDSLASFHIAVKFSDRDKIFQDEFWPNYVLYRPWRLASRNKRPSNGEQ
jgi:hypothetical protein